MFPEYDKAIYIDSDTVVQGDISELYNTELGESYVAACHELAMIQVEEFGSYAERVVGISRYEYFNAGHLLINCNAFRKNNLLEKFMTLLSEYDFVVTQDEDYLNVLCKDRVLWLDQRWNSEAYCLLDYPESEAKVIHYIMTSKPWHYSDCRFAGAFWREAERTAVFSLIRRELDGYTDELRKRDDQTMANLRALALSETCRPDNYLNRLNAKRAKDRVDIIKKIEEYERCGKFDVDVENDPEGEVLMPDDIEYIKKTPLQRIKTHLAFKAARKFAMRLIKEKKFVVKEILGIENFRDLESGAVITCNHFNAFDSFAIQMAYEAAGQRGREFYRVIREGNYTSFPGFYGNLMRNCNTLPLSSNSQTMRKFMKATNTLLRDGHFVLFYPEQSMWWNYRKPKPLKEGAYFFAAKNNVPVLPCFITMRDTDLIGEDGYCIQEYTVHVCDPIYPDETLDHADNVKNLMEKNARAWREVYESTYGIELRYTTRA
jgi:lipopolysaccharide biosynthesis glycosyltransferase